jgi:hypothetical protein
LKRVNTSKALKKGVTATKPKKVWVINHSILT